MVITGLISDYATVGISPGNYKHYEDLGYEIPMKKSSERYCNKTGKEYCIKQGEKIKVKIQDLIRGSNAKVNYVCDCCNKIYTTTYNEYNRHNHNGKTYCNYCKSKILISGENNYKYNPNLTDEERNKNRLYPENIDFIKKVLARDNYTCQCCGRVSNGDMVAHHLDGYNWCEEKRFDISNGIALCDSCHKNFHSLYGKGNNTKEQFEEWIGHTVGELEKYDGELPTARKVICLETGRIYDSAEKCAKVLNLKSVANLYLHCNRVKNTYGYYNKKIKGKHFIWLNIYDKMTYDDIKEYYKWCSPSKSGGNKSMSKKVKCVTTNKIFNSITDACRYYNLNSRSEITYCCRGDQGYSGKLNDGTKLKWEYYTDTP